MSRALAIAAAMLPLAAGASAQPVGFGAHDEGAPIEITADELEVRQNENVATFAGDVDAVQGDLTLSADALDVFYGDEGTGGEDEGADTLGEIRRVVARGNVVVSSPTEVARGARGVYDLRAGEITLTGDVVLTRDENVLRGNELRIDLASGVSTMRGGGAQGRVRALFAPGNAE